MEITIVEKHQHTELVELICSANAPVAKQLGLNKDNANGHTAFYTQQRLLTDIAKGNRFYVGHLNDQLCGCIALRKADAKVWYINRLATLPKFQNHGIASQLLNFCIEQVEHEAASLIRAGIIAEQTELKAWYLKRGFKAGKTKSYARLPFKITYLSYHLADKE